MQYTASSVDPSFDDIGYRYADSSNDSGPANREAALWCAVIEQAFVDVGIIKPKNSKGLPAGGDYFAAAHRWLTRDRVDFHFVCGLAGVNPEVIRMGASAKQERFS